MLLTKMASIFRQPILSIASKVLHSSSKIVSKTAPSILSAPQIATRGLTLSRNYWCISSFGIRRSPESHRVNNYCGCRSYFSKGDEELVKFLEQEISDEKRIEHSPASGVDGWQTTKEGTNVKLTKKFNDETVTVDFDVNDTVDAEEPIYDGNEAQDTPAMVSKPPFDVEIRKTTGKNLRFICEFTPPEPQFDEQGAEVAQEENIEDQFSIVEVQVDGDEKFENSYSLSSSVMDGVMYDLMMDMLDERGIDDDFINNLVDFSTSYEHIQYVDFLENLKKIISDK